MLNRRDATMHYPIKIIGLGAGDINQLPLGVYRLLLKEKLPIYLRTKDHPVVDTLAQEGVKFESFDHLYEQETTFAEVYEQIVASLVQRAKKSTIIYAVPGHPMVAEQTVQLLLKEKDLQVNIVGGQSYLDDLFTSLRIDPIEGFQFVDGTSFQRDELNYSNHIVFSQVYDQMIASH